MQSLSRLILIFPPLLLLRLRFRQLEESWIQTQLFVGQPLDEKSLAPVDVSRRCHHAVLPDFCVVALNDEG